MEHCDNDKNCELEEITLQMAELTLRKRNIEQSIFSKSIFSNVDIICVICLRSSLLSKTKCASVCKLWKRVFTDNNKDNIDYVCFQEYQKKVALEKEVARKERKCLMCFKKKLVKRFTQLGYCAKCEEVKIQYSYYYPKGNGWILINRKRLTMMAIREQVAIKLMGKNHILHEKMEEIHDDEEYDINKLILHYMHGRNIKDVNDMREIIQHIEIYRTEVAKRDATLSQNEIIKINREVIESMTDSEFVENFSVIIQHLSSGSYSLVYHPRSVSETVTGWNWIPALINLCKNACENVLFHQNRSN